MRVGSLYLENFKEVARAVSDRHGRDEVGVEEYAIKFFTETYLREHESLFDVKRGGQITYLGGSSAKVGVPEGVDEPDPVDEFDTDDGYSEVTDDEKLDFEPEYPDRLTDEGDEKSAQAEEQPDSDDDGDPDDGDDGTEKMTFSMESGPPETDV